MRWPVAARHTNVKLQNLSHDVYEKEKKTIFRLYHCESAGRVASQLARVGVCQIGRPDRAFFPLCLDSKQREEKKKGSEIEYRISGHLVKTRSKNSVSQPVGLLFLRNGFESRGNIYTTYYIVLF